MRTCGCSVRHQRRRVVLTGGPGAGKTATLELVRQQFCEHVHILPESASIIFGGGFPRGGARAWREAAQRAIFHVQRELEAVADVDNAAIVLCDRGTADGAAYWPGDEFWAGVGTSREAELQRYDVVIHLRTPGPHEGYDNGNPLRTEPAALAAEIDARLLRVWEGHPRRFVVPSSADFVEKAQQALRILSAELPACCRGTSPPSP